MPVGGLKPNDRSTGPRLPLLSSGNREDGGRADAIDAHDERTDRRPTCATAISMRIGSSVLKRSVM